MADANGGVATRILGAFLLILFLGNSFRTDLSGFTISGLQDVKIRPQNENHSTLAAGNQSPVLSLTALFNTSINSFLKNISLDEMQARNNEETEKSSNIASSVLKEGEFAIFYNVYAHPNISEDRFSRIVKEQIGQVHDSAFRNATLYYVTIGRNLTNVCPERNNHSDFGKCVFLEHYETGWEERTLTMLHRYCLRYPNDTVAYIHNKGSLNDRGSNTAFRRIATKAVLSEACKNVSHHDQFNVCGTHFNIAPHLHYSTNFWTARCGYVRKLIPPRYFDSVRKRTCKDFLSIYHNELPSCGMNMSVMESEIPTRNDYGTGRYAMERWIANHPLFSPSDSFHGMLTKVGNFGWGPWEPKLASPDCCGFNFRRKEMFHGQRRILASYVRELKYLHGEHDLRGGICDVLIGKSRPNMCSGQTSPISNMSIYETVVKPMLESEPTDPF